MSKKPKYSVYITSAINAKFSVYNPETRLQQTLNTIDSVKERIPGAEITLIECGVPGINADVEKQITDRVTNYVNLSGLDNVQWLAANMDRQDVVKNLTEAMVLREMVTVAKDRNWFANSDRIFKISGRYWVTDKFNINTHTDKKYADKFIFRKKNLSQFRPEHTGVPLQLQTRMYSYPPAMLDRYAECLDIMIETMQEYFNTYRYVDIEHLWWKILHTSEYVELDKIGVAGFIAPNGQVIDD
jgi:hypothetical protein